MFQHETEDEKKQKYNYNRNEWGKQERGKWFSDFGNPKEADRELYGLRVVGRIDREGNY